MKLASWSLALVLMPLVNGCARRSLEAPTIAPAADAGAIDAPTADLLLAVAADDLSSPPDSAPSPVCAAPANLRLVVLPVGQFSLHWTLDGAPADAQLFFAQSSQPIADDAPLAGPPLPVDQRAISVALTRVSGVTYFRVTVVEGGVRCGQSPDYSVDPLSRLGYLAASDVGDAGGTQLYAYEPISGTTTQLSAATGKTIGVYRFAWSPTGRMVAYLQSESSPGLADNIVPSTLFVVAADGSARRTLVADAYGGPSSPAVLSWSPSGDQLLYGDKNHQLWVQPLNGTPQLLAGTSFDEGDGNTADWSDDGHVLYNGWAGNLYRTAPGWPSPEPVVTTSDADALVRWGFTVDEQLLSSPVDYGTSPQDEGPLFFSPATSNAPLQLIAPEAAWYARSPVSAQVAFSAPNEGRIDVFTTSANGWQNISQLPVGLRAIEPAWSADGTYVAYTVAALNEMTSGSKVYVGSPGASPVPVPGDADSSWPVWSPDGHTLTYCSDVAPDGEALLFDVRSQTGRVLNASSCSYYEWSPDGRFIAFDATSPGLQLVTVDGSTTYLPSGAINGPPSWSATFVPLRIGGDVQ